MSERENQNIVIYDVIGDQYTTYKFYMQGYLCHAIKPESSNVFMNR